jgi:hypothetical protein
MGPRLHPLTLRKSRRASDVSGSRRSMEAMWAEWLPWNSSSATCKESMHNHPLSLAANGLADVRAPTAGSLWSKASKPQKRVGLDALVHSSRVAQTATRCCASACFHVLADDIQ